MTYLKPKSEIQYIFEMYSIWLYSVSVLSIELLIYICKHYKKSHKNGQKNNTKQKNEKKNKIKNKIQCQI